MSIKGIFLVLSVIAIGIAMLTSHIDIALAQPATNSYSNTGLTASTTYYYRVAAVNSSGVIGTPSNITSGTTSGTTPPPDTTAPTVTITSPKNGSSLPGGNILVQGTASDNTGGSGINNVSARYGNTVPYATATPSAPGNWSKWSITFSITTAGSHIIIARATDKSGNQQWYEITIKTSGSTTTRQASPSNAGQSPPPSVASSSGATQKPNSNAAGNVTPAGNVTAAPLGAPSKRIIVGPSIVNASPVTSEIQGGANATSIPPSNGLFLGTPPGR
jgi:hypothetical protein